VLALWVAFADLIPLVGATLGAVVAVIAAFFVSTPAGIIAIVFFALYQQFENSVLQIAIMSRAVKVSPLVVLLSLLLGVELFGPIGALLSVPIAGAMSVVAKELWRHRPPSAHDLVVIGNSGADDPDTKPKREHRWAHLGRRRRERGRDARPEPSGTDRS
jgi:predicted PurR-regulated permease PerM